MYVVKLDMYCGVWFDSERHECVLMVPVIYTRAFYCEITRTEHSRYRNSLVFGVNQNSNSSSVDKFTKSCHTMNV